MKDERTRRQAFQTRVTAVALLVILTTLYLMFSARVFPSVVRLTMGAGMWSGGGLAWLVLQNALYFVAIAAGVGCSTRDPGTIRPAKSSGSARTKQSGTTATGQNAAKISPLMRDQQAEGGVLRECTLLDGTVANLRYCMTCCIWKPPRSHHCRVCGVCVASFDHHCPWLGTCIGFRNYRLFLVHISATTLATLSVLVMCCLRVCADVGVLVAPHVLAHLDSSVAAAAPASHGSFSISGSDSDWRPILVAIATAAVRIPDITVAIIISGVACASFGYLLLYHIRLIAKGITTKEYIRRVFSPANPNPYDRGILRNFWHTVRDSSPHPHTVVSYFRDADPYEIGGLDAMAAIHNISVVPGPTFFDKKH